MAFSPPRAVPIHPVPVAVGRRGWTKRLDPYALPRGLAPRTPVLVQAIDTHAVAVQTEDHRIWSVYPRWMIDCGYTFDLPGDGSHTPENHPGVITYLQVELGNLRRIKWQREVERDRQGVISRYKWILTRNGHPPDPADDPDQARAEEEFDRAYLTPDAGDGCIDVSHPSPHPAA